MQIDALTALHPSQPMLTDLDNRLLSFLAQRRDLLQTTHKVSLPNTAGYATPALRALPSSAPSPQFDRHIEQLQEQERAALRRVLNRDRDEMLKNTEITLRAQYDAELISARQRMIDDAAQRRNAVIDKYAPDLLAAKISIDSVGRAINSPSFPVAKVAEERYPLVQKTYMDLIERRRMELEAIDSDLSTALLALAEEKRQSMLAQLQTTKEQLEQTNNRLYAAKDAKLKDELSTYTAVDVPVMVFPEIPAGEIAPVQEDITDRFARIEAMDRKGSRADIMQIDDDIAQLIKERKRLQLTILNDTWSIAKAVAEQQSYKIVPRKAGSKELTSTVRSLLAKYWALN